MGAGGAGDAEQIADEIVGVAEDVAASVFSIFIDVTMRELTPYFLTAES